jgi:hypothetical protein
MKQKLRTNEKVEADRGYRGDDKIRTPDDWVTLSDRKAKSCARSRHETVDGRLKIFKSMSGTFRHELYRHKYLFCTAIATIQLMFEYHGTTHDVRY